MMYPKEPIKHALDARPDLKRQIWKALNEISPKLMLSEGRVYGGGLHKLEPRELSKVPADKISELVPELNPWLQEKQGTLFK